MPIVHTLTIDDMGNVLFTTTHLNGSVTTLFDAEDIARRLETLADEVREANR